MATANSTRRSAGSSLSAQTDEFAALSRRLLITINQVTLVSQHFGDLTSLSADDAPDGLVLCQAAKDLDQIYDELDAWEVRHEHMPKSVGTQTGLGVFTDDDSARSPLSGLPVGFLALIEPVEPHTWWQDPPNSPSHVVGFEYVLRTLERSLRSNEVHS